MGIFDLQSILEKEVPDSEIQSDDYTDIGEDSETSKNVSVSSEDNYELPDDAEEGEEDAGDITDDTGDEPEDTDGGDEGGEDDDETYELPDEEGNEDETDTEGEETNDEDITDGEAEPTDEEEVEENPEDEIFSDMSDAEKLLRDKDLLDTYNKLYHLIYDMMSKLNTLSRTEENAEKIDFIIHSFMNMKNTILDHILYSYSIKTYIENQNIYYQYVAAYDNLNRMLAELVEKEEEK